MTSPKHQSNTKHTTDGVDYDGLMQANIRRVFSERDAAQRLKAIRELYAEDATLCEPQTSARGHVAICDAVSALLASLPANFAFTAAAPAVGHHGVGRLNWRSGPPGAPPVVTGTDVARFEGGRIQSLHVFLDPGNV
jgi:hypothetical protein